MVVPRRLGRRAAEAVRSLQTPTGPACGDPNGSLSLSTGVEAGVEAEMEMDEGVWHRGVPGMRGGEHGARQDRTGCIE